MAKGGKRKRNALDSVSPAVGDLIHSKFGEVWFNGTVTAIDGDHFLAMYSDGKEERCSCDPNVWSIGHLPVEPEPAKATKKKTAPKKKRSQQKPRRRRPQK